VIIPDMDEFIARCRRDARRILSGHNAANADVARPLTTDEQMAVDLGVIAGIQAVCEALGVEFATPYTEQETTNG